MTTCPNTGAVVSTGQHLNKAEFEQADNLKGRFRCSACQQVHEWTKNNVQLADWPGATSYGGC